MNSRPIHALDCRTKSFVLAICLADEDLIALAALDDDSSCNLLSANVRGRNYVHSSCRTDTPLARAVADRLDLRFADEVLAVRCASDDEVRTLVRDALDETRTSEFAPLWWSLMTDARAAVQVLGQQLLAACFVEGCRSIREAHAARRER